MVRTQIVDEEFGWNAYHRDGIDGFLAFYLTQPALSRTVLEDINPVSIPTMIGAIAGAWGKSGT